MRKNYFVNPITKRFIDAFPRFKAPEGDNKVYFWEGWKNSPFYEETLNEDDLRIIYNHLMAAYYDWHFIYMDDLGISNGVYHIIEEYYPNTKERLNILEELRALDIEEFKKSGVFIDSSAANPKTPKQMDELVDLVDAQNASFQLKSQEQALRAKYSSLIDGIMEEFITRFKGLFVKLYNGVNSYIYTNKFDELDEEDEN